MNKDIRDAWVAKQLNLLTHGSVILDAGAGERQYIELCEHLQYVSQDFCQYDGSGNNQGLQTETWNTCNIDIISDINTIPKEDNSFDAILCTEVLEHIPEPISAIKEFSRLLKNGGKLILTAPFCSLTHFSPYHYYSGFNKYFYEHFLPLYGFKILEIEANGGFFEYLIQELYRVEYVAKIYTNQFTTYDMVHDTISLLKTLNDCDIESSELLCFGYHVAAQKTHG